MEHRGSISDDWEELSDSFSVVSVPTSEHGDDKPLLHGDIPDTNNPPVATDLPLRPARSRPSPAEAPTPSLPVPIPHPREAPVSEPSLAVSVSDALRRASLNEEAAQSEGKQEADSHTSDPHLQENQQQPADWQRAGPPMHDTGDESSDGEVDEILDAHIDPAFFLSVLKSLDGFIDEILAMSGALISNRSATAIEKVCRLLSLQIKELTPIISGYARCWSSSSQDIPLDPGLQAWMSGVRVKLVGLHAEMQHQVPTPFNYSYQSDRSFEASCQEYCDALSQYEKQMDIFLPIMQVDYNEFEAGQMNFPVQTARGAAGPNTKASPIDIRNPSTAARPLPVRPSSETWQLRQALYDLRDRLQDSVEKLSQCTSILTPSASALCRDVVQSYGVLFNNLSLILSNHGSDWIEHGLRGGLTYAQFMDMDVGVIRDFTAQLSQALDCLGDGPCSQRTYWEQRYGDPRQDETSSLREGAIERYGADSRRRSMLLDEGLLASFETLAEVLTATLIPSQA